MVLEQVQAVSEVTACEKTVLFWVVDADPLVEKILRRALHDLLEQRVVVHVRNVNAKPSTLREL
jgi:hypothetical protein